MFAQCLPNSVNFHTAGRVKVDCIWLYTRPVVCIASFSVLVGIKVKARTKNSEILLINFRPQRRKMANYYSLFPSVWTKNIIYSYLGFDDQHRAEKVSQQMLKSLQIYSETTVLFSTAAMQWKTYCQVHEINF